MTCARMMEQAPGMTGTCSTVNHAEEVSEAAHARLGEVIVPGEWNCNTSLYTISCVVLGSF